jgi:hypothetical protein
MIGIAYCWEPLPAFVSLGLGRWALGRSDRGRQDKNRKVRTVGFVRNSAEFCASGTHCECILQIALFRNMLSSLRFRHLGSNHER